VADGMIKKKQDAVGGHFSSSRLSEKKNGNTKEHDTDEQQKAGRY
jgi:hypothetical protein